ncbi:hypothetical protein YC2023_081792 [Brassica napus]
MKRLIWCVRALQPKERLGEKGRDQDQAVRRSRRDLEDVEEQMGECANIGRGRTAMYGPVRTGTSGEITTRPFEMF